MTHFKKNLPISGKLQQKIINQEEPRFVRSCIHCTDEPCWCIMAFLGDDKETQI